MTFQEYIIFRLIVRLLNALFPTTSFFYLSIPPLPKKMQTLWGQVFRIDRCTESRLPMKLGVYHTRDFAHWIEWVTPKATIFEATKCFGSLPIFPTFLPLQPSWFTWKVTRVCDNGEKRRKKVEKTRETFGVRTPGAMNNASGMKCVTATFTFHSLPCKARYTCGGGAPVASMTRWTLWSWSRSVQYTPAAARL
jgi:hypothetical protein